jgi:hypothetical protein
LQEVGFRQKDRAGWKRGGFYHPALLIGVEFVSGAYFDGYGDRARIRLLDLESGAIPVAAVEDLIADRMGQWEAANRRAPEMLRQAQLLMALAGELDDTYLDRRIREETAGGCNLSALKALTP